MKKILTNGLTYKSEQLEEALYKVEDLFERLQIPMICLGQTAKDIKEGNEGLNEGLKESDGVYVGFRRIEFNGQKRSTLFSIQPDIKEIKNGFYFEHKGVPINIKMIKRNYKFFKNLDIKFFKITEFFIPNSFESYWRARFIIQ